MWIGSGSSQLDDELLNFAPFALGLFRGFLHQLVVNFEFFLGIQIFAGSSVGLGQSIMGFFHARIERDCFLESGDGLGEILAGGINDSELKMRVREGGVELKRILSSESFIPPARISPRPS